MKNFFLAVLVLMISINTFSQAKKIGYRHDNYVNNAWQGIDSVVYDYNADSNLTLLYAVKGDTNNTWDVNYKYTYTYDANQNKIGQLREKWIGSNFVNENKYIYTYDGNNNLTLVEYFTWSLGVWNNTGKITYTGYNASGLPAQVITQAWSNNTWANIGRSDYAYYTPGDLVQSQDDYLWDVINIAWKRYERRYYTYLQNLIGSITVSEPDTNNNWQSKNKVINSYNTTNLLLIQQRNQLFDTLHQAYDINRTIFTYSGTNKLVEEMYETPLGTTWSQENRKTYVYNTADTLTEYYTELNTSGWVLDQRTTLAYTNGLVAEQKHFIGNAGTWLETEIINNTYNADSLVTFIQKESYSNSVYTPAKREFFYYNVNPLAFHQFNWQENLRLYPNPCANEISLDLLVVGTDMATILIYDMQGRCRLSLSQPLKTGANKVIISTVDLPNGMYTVTASYAGKKKSWGGIFIKE
jgi:Secretion system C-terminal sorting domain